jgi:iron-sulfur cluster repair protein YtfE (RIC family)
MSEEYAYGDWEADGEKCPLASANMEDAYYSNELAEEFDNVARDMLKDSGMGTMEEEQAAEAWNKLVYYLRTRLHKEDTEYLQNLLFLAEDVQSVEFDG